MIGKIPPLSQHEDPVISAGPALEDIHKFAMDDARQRLKAMVDMILATDRQAMTLLGFCVSISVASGTGAAATFAPGGWVPVGIGAGLLLMAVGFTAAAVQCLYVMQPGEIGLPGRLPDFWR